ncbi:MAG: hypothetical protein NVSMB18_17850 [Acetobacteraceae bacterium]
MTDATAATPGWVDQRLDTVFAGVSGLEAARAAYADCLGRRKAPAAPSDLLGAEFTGCRDPLRHAMVAAGIDAATMARVDGELEALEADIAADS